MSFKSLLEEKNKRLSAIPLAVQTEFEKNQNKILSKIIKELSTLDTKGGEIKISGKNLDKISKIFDELESIFLTDDYKDAVKEFSKEIGKQSVLNAKLVKETLGLEVPIVADSYIALAKKSAVEQLLTTDGYSKPLRDLIEQAVVSGASIDDTINSITDYVIGKEGKESRILKYVKQVTNDSFAIADRSFTSIISDFLGNDWYLYAGVEIEGTRCFCRERVNQYFHFKEIEAWGRGDDIGECETTDGNWAGKRVGTNESTIFSYLGGYECQHSLIPVSEAIVPESDVNRVKELGYYEDN